MGHYCGGRGTITLRDIDVGAEVGLADRVIGRADEGEARAIRRKRWVEDRGLVEVDDGAAGSTWQDDLDQVPVSAGCEENVAATGADRATNLKLLGVKG